MKKSKNRIRHYPPELRGLAANRYGGNQLQRERGLRGAQRLPPRPCKVFSEDEKRQYEEELRARGLLNPEPIR